MKRPVIAQSAELLDSGRAALFQVSVFDRTLPAFVIRYQGQVYAYVNECAHVPVELDQNPGHVFDMSGQFLVCSFHGAYYSPTQGTCLGGPCRGASLRALTVEECDGQVWLLEDEKHE